LGNRCPLDVGLIGTVGDTLIPLLPLIDEKTDTTHLDRALADYRRARADLDALSESGPNSKIIHPQYVSRIVSAMADDDAIFSCDVGTPVGLSFVGRRHGSPRTNLDSAMVNSGRAFADTIAGAPARSHCSLRSCISPAPFPRCPWGPLRARPIERVAAPDAPGVEQCSQLGEPRYARHRILVLCARRQRAVERSRAVSLPDLTMMEVPCPKPATDPLRPERYQHVGFCCSLFPWRPVSPLAGNFLNDQVFDADDLQRDKLPVRWPRGTTGPPSHWAHTDLRRAWYRMAGTDHRRKRRAGAARSPASRAGRAGSTCPPAPAEGPPS
jgi:hypothetical protein